MRPIDAEPLEEILRLRCAQCSNAYGSLAGAANGCLKLMQAQPTIAPPPNGPLTLEQLREMEGEPVWISYVNSAKGKYHIVRAFGPNSIIFDEYDKEFGPYKSLFLGNYGKTWLAYRRRPEEGTA